MTTLTRQQPGAPIDLGELTGREVLKLQLILGLTAKELMEETSVVTVESMPRDLENGRALHLALAHFGPLTDGQVTSAFGWSMQELEAAVEALEGPLAATGRQVQRSEGALNLQEKKGALPSKVADALQAHHDWSLPVLAQEACLLVASLRQVSHGAHNAVELPVVTVTELVQRGIAVLSRAPADESGEPGEARAAEEDGLPFVLHPDVVFAFSAGEPPMTGEVVKVCADHGSDLL
ncbi:hypothetical protein [Streptosporangium sp. V21-05]|uniref:hypothetical protein n=1 Tax=Streptosporangium sp. V21-05 TaxID=3446115 RepID=UPI003F53E4EF